MSQEEEEADGGAGEGEAAGEKPPAGRGPRAGFRTMPVELEAFRSAKAEAEASGQPEVAAAAADLRAMGRGKDVLFDDVKEEPQRERQAAEEANRAVHMVVAVPERAGRGWEREKKREKKAGAAPEKKAGAPASEKKAAAGTPEKKAAAPASEKKAAGIARAVPPTPRGPRATDAEKSGETREQPPSVGKGREPASEVAGLRPSEGEGGKRRAVWILAALCGLGLVVFLMMRGDEESGSGTTALPSASMTALPSASEAPSAAVLPSATASEAPPTSTDVAPVPSVAASEAPPTSTSAAAKTPAPKATSTASVGPGPTVAPVVTAVPSVAPVVTAVPKSSATTKPTATSGPILDRED